MKELIFYEKPGCHGNARQKELLRSHGYHLMVKSIIDEKWTAKKLRPYFGHKRLEDWFNMNAPLVRDNMINFNELDEESALDLLIADPILIKRPLIEYNKVKYSGFDDNVYRELIGIQNNNEDLEQCRQKNG